MGGCGKDVGWGEWNEAQLCWLYEGNMNIPRDFPLRVDLVVGLRYA